MSYGVSLAVHETPPEDHGSGRRCAKCGSRVSRYQNKYHGTLLCFRCQRVRLDFLVGQADFLTDASSLNESLDLAGLRRAMSRRGVSQAVLATRLGVSEQSISALSRGAERASPERAARVALALGA